MAIRHNIKDPHLLDKYGRIKGSRNLFKEDENTEKRKKEVNRELRGLKEIWTGLKMKLFRRCRGGNKFDEWW